MALSYTYSFGQNTLVDNFLVEAYERCGIPGTEISGQQVDSAIRSLNFMLSEWVNLGLNLFTVQKSMLQINIGQPSYTLPTSTVDALEVTASNNTRLLGGTAFSSAGGVPGNAFNGSPTTACTQNAPNGYISYTYPTGYTPSVYYVGVQSNQSINYNLVFEYSFDGATWVNGLTIGSLYYPIGQIIWSVVGSPTNAMSVRIRETGGETLDVQQIYFSMPSQSRILTSISREEWTSYSDKQQQSTPSSYYLDRQITPILTLWPTPDNSYQTIVYNRSQQIMDVQSLIENIDIPQRFMEAVVSGLAARVALKFSPDVYETLQAYAERAYTNAAMEDEEKVPLRIQPNIYKYT